jgi:hypothetical protein
VIMDEDVAKALLNGGVLAADVLVEDLNVVLGKAADGRELPRQREARGLVAGGCRERELESERHEQASEDTRRAGRSGRRRARPSAVGSPDQAPRPGPLRPGNARTTTLEPHQPRWDPTRLIAIEYY